MPDHYLRLAAEATAKRAPDPRAAVVLAVIVPLAVVILGYALLRSVVIDNSTGYAVSYADVRTAITEVIEQDLATERLEQVLGDLGDPMPATDETKGDARTTERSTRLKVVAGRLHGDRKRLADLLTELALVPHPGRDQAVVMAKDGADRRQQIATIVEERLVDTAVRAKTTAWVADALDARARGAIANAVASAGKTTAEQVVANAVADSLAVDALRRSSMAAVALPYDPFDARPGESAWASDVAARLLWVVAALLFALTFGLYQELVASK